MAVSCVLVCAVCGVLFFELYYMFRVVAGGVHLGGAGGFGRVTFLIRFGKEMFQVCFII